MKPAAGDVKLGAVVGHQPGALVDQPQRQIRFARAAFAQSSTPCAAASPTQLAWILTRLHVMSPHRERQFDDEARAAAGCLAVVRFSAQMRPPAFCVIWRAMDRPRPEFLPKMIAGPLGIEALEDGFQIVRRNAGAFVLHRHPGEGVLLARGDARWCRLPGLNEIALSIRLRNTWPSRSSRPDHHGAGRQIDRPASTVDVARRFGDVDRSPRWSPADATDRPARASRGDSSASRREASEMSVISRSMRFTSSRTIAISFCARRRRPARARASPSRCCQRGERVLQFMRHVGGEAFDGVDAVVERRASWPSGCRPDRRSRHCARASRGWRRGRRGRAHLVGGRGQPAHRLGDGAGQIERGQQHHREGDQEHLDQGDAFLAQDVVDVAAFGGDQQHAIDGA